MFEEDLISTSQLSSSVIVTSFMGGFWKLTKGAMVIALGKKEGTFCLTLGSLSTITVISLKVKV